MALVGNWVQAEVWTDATGGSKINDPASWINGRYLRIYANQNTGNARSETIQVAVSDAGIFDLSVSQAGADPTLSVVTHDGITYSIIYAIGYNGGSSWTVYGTIGGLTGTEQVYFDIVLDGVSQGRVLVNKANGTSETTINTYQLGAGTYVLSIYKYGGA